MYGAQTDVSNACVCSPFENDVEMYGAQTINEKALIGFVFENDVEMYGAQTEIIGAENITGLRMM